MQAGLDSAAVSIFVVILVELTITAFVNSTNKSTNIETTVLSRSVVDFIQLSQWPVASFYQPLSLCLRLFVMIFMFAPEFFLELISVNLHQHHPSSLYFCVFAIVSVSVKEDKKAYLTVCNFTIYSHFCISECSLTQVHGRHGSRRNGAGSRFVRQSSQVLGLVHIKRRGKNMKLAIFLKLCNDNQRGKYGYN